MNYSLWFISFDDLKPGNSAILGDNLFTFCAIHGAALILSLLSVLASVAVITHILMNRFQGKGSFDVAVRFPLYLCTYDIMWGLSHFSGHYYLVTVQIIPTNGGIIDIMSILAGLFFGFTHMSRIGIAGYTYLHIVHGKRWHMGRWEWKLHLGEFLILAWPFPILYPIKSFGFSGYWMGYDATTLGGHLLVLFAGVVSTLNGICTVFGYYGIRKKIMETKNNLEWLSQLDAVPYEQQQHLRHPGTKVGMTRSARNHSKALKCLTTYVFIGCFLYCPMAVIFWVYLWIHLWLSCVDPLTSFLIVIGTNSTGWVTACGYFYNEWAKGKYERMCNQPPGYLSLSSLNTFLIVVGANSTGWVTACGYFYNERAKQILERKGHHNKLVTEAGAEVGVG